MTTHLDQVTDFPALVEYLRDELEWPIPADISLDEATYDVTPEEIGLKSAVVGGGIEIKQLRPLNRAQPWGVFFLNLPNAKLPVTLVRNILGKLALKKRASANKSQQAAFAKHDLLFITATGSAADRRLAFAHFADDEVKGDAATLKVLGWDADDTPRRLGLTEASLKTKLHWPDNPADTDHWRKQWGEAFAHSDTRTVVRDSKAMAKALAAVARRIRERAKELIAAQTDTGSLVKLHKAFKEALIHDLTPEGFADTYAQTIAYGLLSTAISRASGALTQEDMAANVAGTSPFLKEMLGTFIEAGGRKSGKAQGLDFDELGITEVVELLRNADMEAVLADFDRKNPDEDPVIHFYELFLKEYDAAQKVKRGVFYTPRPVVGFIVRSVDEVLRTEFGLEDGLASTATWGEVITAKSEINLPEGAKASDPFVRILDPATGTGTFLVECVDLIHKTMIAKWTKAGKRAAEIKALWNDYVPNHLLPRLAGFELMMAPYAIAHVKLGLKLADTGYTFGSDARAQIYLTNALEPAQDFDLQLAFMSEALAHEAKAANEAKEARFTVVVGNPPYAEKSNNRHPWIESLMEDFKTTIRDEEAQIKTVSNDYAKFIRLALWQIEQTTPAVMGFITSSGFLDGPLFRDARRHISSKNRIVRILNLHGSARRGDATAGDENVFEIQQGVCISIISARLDGQQTEILYGELVGGQKSKLEALTTSGLRDRFTRSLATGSNSRPFVPFKDDANDAIENWPINHIFGTGSPKADRNKRYGAGFKSRQDKLVVALTKQELEGRIADLANPLLTEKQVRATYNLCSTAHFEFRKARAYAQQDLLTKTIISLRYRPFDDRPMIWSRVVMCEPQESVTQHLLPDHLCLTISRVVKDPEFRHVLAAKGPVEVISLSGSTSTNAYMFPLWWHDTATRKFVPNFAPAFAKRIAELIELVWDDCVEEPKQGMLGGIVNPKPEQTAMFAGARRERGERGKSFGPRDLFDYIYAVLHTPAYRARYADYLKSDFARIPLPASRALFEALVPIGTELVALHLLDAEALPALLKDPKSVRLAGSGKAQVTMAAAKYENDAFDNGRMYIAADQSRWFETVSEQAADFHVGGYRPARKWLKDRAAKGGKKASDGRVLTEADILHYRRMIVALARTAELMPTIDEVIEKHGGWPGAFKGMTDDAKSETADA